MPRNMDMSNNVERSRNNHENENDIIIVAVHINSGGILAYEFWLYKIVLFNDANSFCTCYNCICD